MFSSRSNSRSHFNGFLDSSVLFKNSDLTHDVKAHLLKVYLTLACTVLSAGVGCLLHVTYNLGGLLSVLCTFALLTWLYFEQDQTKRLGILNGFAMAQGISIGPLVSLVLTLDSGTELIAKAFLGAAIVFGCFSASALFAPRRSYLYLYGVLSSALLLMSYMALANFFIASPMLASVSLYFGLFTFVGFVVFDTQMILEKAHMGDRDFVSHALELFIDFVQIFVRLLIILTKNSKKRKE